MDNIYTSDWHIHTEASYDATLTYKDLIRNAKEIGITDFGITEHVNYLSFCSHLQKSRKQFEENYVDGMHFGVELSPLSNFQHIYSIEHNLDPDAPTFGGMPPEFSLPGHSGKDPELVKLSSIHAKPFVLCLTEDVLREYKVEYVVAAAHCIYSLENDRKTLIKHWHEQQMLCATDERVDIVGHPWWMPFSKETMDVFVDASGKATGEPWFDDFNVIPKSIHDEFAAALIENEKCIEMNTGFLTTDMYPEKFKHQYVEYMRDMFEKGVSVTIGTDSHDEYPDIQEKCKYYLAPVGFTADDFSKPKFRTY